MKAVIVFMLALTTLVIILGIGPVLTILSLNALFNTGIALTFTNMLACGWLWISGVLMIALGRI